MERISKLLREYTQRFIDINHSIVDEIKEASLLGQEARLAELCDTYGQFMCDAIQDSLRKARGLEGFIEECPETKDIVEQMIQIYRNNASLYADLYTKFEKKQREGVIPTQLRSGD